MNAERIPIKTRAEIEAMREAGRQVAEILLELRELVEPLSASTRQKIIGENAAQVYSV